MFFPLQDAKTLKTTNLAFDLSKIVKSLIGIGLEDFINDSEVIINRMSEEILKPIQTQSESATQLTKRESASRLLVQNPRPTEPPHYHDESRDRLRDPLRDIGRGDLDPFGRGGGMIFQPDMPFAPGGFGPLGPLPGPGRLGFVI